VPLAVGPRDQLISNSSPPRVPIAPACPQATASR
jgi:hypothetical protein